LLGKPVDVVVSKDKERIIEKEALKGISILYKARPDEVKLNLSIELINKLVDIIISEVDVEKIAIFGSMARGDFTQSSDVDVALFGVDRGNVMFVRDRLNEELNTLRDVDLIVFEELKNDALKSKILKEGIVVYERNYK